jgi:4-methyl-5(b-hydroxyethyl)-thiazole monophosphate biosynthesis
MDDAGDDIPHTAMKSALVILTDNFEEIEAVTPIDLLRRAEVAVTVASRTGSLAVTGRSGIAVTADCLLQAAEGRLYDLLVLPGGPGHKALRADPRVIAVTKAHAEAGKLVGAICAAPVILKDAGLLAERRHTAHHSVAGELPNLIAGEDVVVDGHLVTSRGAGTSAAFALTLTEILCGRGKAEQVARSICYTGAWASPAGAQ